MKQPRLTTIRDYFGGPPPLHARGVDPQKVRDMLEELSSEQYEGEILRELMEALEFSRQSPGAPPREGNGRSAAEDELTQAAEEYDAPRPEPETAPGDPARASLSPPAPSRPTLNDLKSHDTEPPSVLAASEGGRPLCRPTAQLELAELAELAELVRAAGQRQLCDQVQNSPLFQRCLQIADDLSPRLGGGEAPRLVVRERGGPPLWSLQGETGSLVVVNGEYFLTQDGMDIAGGDEDLMLISPEGTIDLDEGDASVGPLEFPAETPIFAELSGSYGRSAAGAPAVVAVLLYERMMDGIRLAVDEEGKPLWADASYARGSESLAWGVCLQLQRTPALLGLPPKASPGYTPTELTADDAHSYRVFLNACAGLGIEPERLAAEIIQAEHPLMPIAAHLGAESTVALDPANPRSSLPYFLASCYNDEMLPGHQLERTHLRQSLHQHSEIKT